MPFSILAINNQEQIQQEHEKEINYYRLKLTKLFNKFHNGIYTVFFIHRKNMIVFKIGEANKTGCYFPDDLQGEVDDFIKSTTK